MDGCIKWKPPYDGFSKLNFDGSVIKDRSASTGFVIRDQQSHPIFAGSKRVPTDHVPTSEALALREGLYFALRRNICKIQVEGDSKLIIDCVLKNCSVPWRLKTLVKDIRWLASQFQEIQFSHILREANFTADAIANIGHSSMAARCWDRCLSQSALPAFRFDLARLGCPRGFRL